MDGNFRARVPGLMTRTAYRLERRMRMRLINFLIWISTGFVIGWVLNQMGKDASRTDGLIPDKISVISKGSTRVASSAHKS